LSRTGDQVWLADITYIPTSEGWLYLAVILDLFILKVVGWAMREHMRAELTIAALIMAIQRRRPRAGVVHHFDRGSQYAASEYRDILQAAAITQSMSRKANCWDNTPMESFFGTLKTELVPTAKSTWCKRRLTWGSVRFPPPDAALVRRRLGTLSHMVCGAPAYLEKHPAPHSPADLAGHNCLRYPHVPSPDKWYFVDARGNPVVARISGRLIFSRYETTRDAAVAGFGLLLTAPFLVADLIASGALVPLLPDYRAQEVEINALYPHRRHLSCKVRAFIDMLVDRFAEQQRCLGPAVS
jgi:hypothetical protein